MLGAELPKTVMGAGPGNAMGHWEPSKLVAINEQMLTEAGSRWDDWQMSDLGMLPARRLAHFKSRIQRRIESEYGTAHLFVLKDPRISRLVPLYEDVLARMDIEPRFVIALRNPLEVLSSLEHRDVLGCQGVARSAGVGRAQTALLWLRHLLEAEAVTRDSKRVIVSFERLFDDCAATLEDISTQLAVRWPNRVAEMGQEISEFLTPTERHHISTTGDLGLDPLMCHWVQEAYIALRKLEDRPALKGPLKALDRTRTEFQHAAPLIEAGLAELRSAHAAERKKQSEIVRKAASKIDEQTTALSSREHENAQLQDRLERTHAVVAQLQDDLEQERTSAAQLARALDDREKDLQAAQSELSETRISVETLTAAIAERETILRELETTASKQRARSEQLESELAGAKLDIQALETRTRTLADATSEMLTALKSADRSRAELSDALHSAQAAKMQMQSSLSWRITKPLRSVTSIVRPNMSNAPAVRKSKSLFYATARAFERAALRAAPLWVRVRPRRSPGSYAEVKRQILQSQKHLEVLRAEWSRPPPSKALSAEDLEQKLLALVPADLQRFVLSVSHDDYKQVTGGVQTCVQIEEQAFVRNGDFYLNIHPHSPAPVLSRETDAANIHFGVIANGTKIGTVDGRTLCDVLGKIIKSEVEVQCIVHSLLGHSPEMLRKMLTDLEPHKCIFWVHDYFTLCPSYNLLRNQITYCHAPDQHSLACSTCVFGEERPNHVRRIEALFDAHEFVVVSPAQYPLDLWQRATALKYKDAVVQPHCTLKWETVPSAADKDKADRSIRIAFLGYPEVHKGWPVFTQMASRLADRTDIDFYQLGKVRARHRGVRFKKVSTTQSDPDAMIQAMVDAQIDAVLLWAIWPETFSFTLYEALGAGTLVITNPSSGNVQAVARQSDRGIVLNDEDALADYLRSDEFAEVVRGHRSGDRTRARLQRSSMSEELV